MREMDAAFPPRTALLLALLLVVGLDDCSHAFVAVNKRGYPPSSNVKVSLLIGNRKHSSSSSSCLLGTNDNSNNNSEEEEEVNIDIEKERKRLESLLDSSSSSNNQQNTEQSTTSSGSSNGSSRSNDRLLNLPISEWKKEMKTSNAPLLTTMGRERMEMEISLLESLAFSDEAVPQLWNLWYNARGPQAAEELEKTEALVAQGKESGAWEEAERLLKELIAREGIHWAEPVNRLATLLFLQGRYVESKELCEVVLALKPWHFGALSGMVMVHQGLHDAEGMVEYATQRMPPLPDEKTGDEKNEPPPELAGKLETRQMWVDRMLDRARAMLLGLEMGLEESFLDLDKQQPKSTQATTSSSTNNSTDTDSAISSTSSSQSTKDEEEEDAWQ